jgi:hypothetical protein
MISSAVKSSVIPGAALQDQLAMVMASKRNVALLGRMTSIRPSKVADRPVFSGNTFIASRGFPGLSLDAAVINCLSVD